VNTESLPVLAEAADVLSDQLRVLLSRLAVLLRPESDRLEARFLTRLEKLKFDVRQRRALSSLTVGAAARFLARGCPPADFFEAVEYSGRRLAKLNLSPSAIVLALGEYDKLLTPVLKRLSPGECDNYQWAREQLQFCVMLTLNNAYYQIREAETQAFYEMFWAELDSNNLGGMLERFLAILARFCKADQAHLYLMSEDGAEFTCRASYGTQSHGPAPFAGTSKHLATARSIQPGESTIHLVLDSSWIGNFATCWSVPMKSRGRVAGVMQFSFVRSYEWLPREEELLTAAAERCMMAAEKARMMEDLSEQQRQIRGLAENMMRVEEAERRRISRELHDQTGQDLLWIRLQLEMLEKDIPEHDGGRRTRLAAIRDMSEKTIVEIRRLIAALSPAVLEQLGLAPALRQLANRFRQNHTSRVKLQIGRLGPLPKQLEVIVYRLVQECLNNIAKHSFCSTVNISLQAADGILRLYVEDDGVGFRVEEAVNKQGSFGLAGIRERVALLGGNCSIESRMMETREPGTKPKATKPKRLSSGQSGNGRHGLGASGTQIRVELSIPDEGGLTKEHRNGALPEISLKNWRSTSRHAPPRPAPLKHAPRRQVSRAGG
jgi:signal transduction histidine kinase